MTPETDHIKKRTAQVEGLIHSQTFDDHEQFAAALRGWIPVARKLDRGPFAASLLQIDFGDVRMIHANIDSVVEMEGAAPKGFQSFGLPAGRQTVGRWCGEAVSGGRFVNLFDESGHFNSVIQPGFETFVVSVREDWLLERGESLEIPVEARRGEARVSEHDPASLQILLAMLQRISLAGLTGMNEDKRVDFRDLLCGNVTGRLLELLSVGRPASRSFSRLRGRILEQARDWIEAAASEELTVSGLCRGIGAGERTVRRVFLEYFGVTPLDYWKAQRLNRVHHELLESDPGHGQVSAIANRWGFWHLGQLAADYRQLFDELPSEMLARAR